MALLTWRVARLAAHEGNLRDAERYYHDAIYGEWPDDAILHRIEACLPQPAAAGAMIGVIGLRFPQGMGAGYAYIDEAMHEQYTWELLGVLAGRKILSTVLSFTSGAPGCLFAPILFIGAMLGGAVGGVERLLFPHLSGSAGAYALVGMGTVFAGILRAPMTSVFMILEVSGNYQIILPVMLSNAIAT
jgi:CIC family chloride channel protein